MTGWIKILILKYLRLSFCRYSLACATTFMVCPTKIATWSTNIAMSFLKGNFLASLSIYFHILLFRTPVIDELLISSPE